MISFTFIQQAPSTNFKNIPFVTKTNSNVNITLPSSVRCCTKQGNLHDNSSSVAPSTTSPIQATRSQQQQQQSSVILKTPRHPRIPFIGALLDTFVFNIRGPDLALRYGDVYYTDVLGDKVYVVTDLSAILKILIDSDTFCSSGAFVKPIRDLFGSGALILSDGTKHANSRSKILAALAPKLFPLYNEKILNSSRLLWDSVSVATEKNKQKNKGVSLGSFVREHFLRVIINISTFSSSANPDPKSLKIKEDEILQLSTTMCEGMLSVPFGPAWNKAWKSRKLLFEIIQNLMLERLVHDADAITQIREGGERFEKLLSSRRTDILNVLLAASTLPVGNENEVYEALKAQDVQDEFQEKVVSVVELWIAGYFSQSSAILSCVMEIRMNEEIKTALLKEQEGIEELNYDNVANKMPLLMSFILEVLRLYPPTFDWYRRTSRPTIINGHEIPGDHLILLDFWASQRSDKYFRDANTLDMRRFMKGHRPEEQRQQETSRFVSFGAVGGPHYCVGAAFAKIALKTTLATMLREYDLDVHPRATKQYDTYPYFQPQNGVKAVNCKRKTRLEKVHVNPEARSE